MLALINSCLLLNVERYDNKQMVLQPTIKHQNNRKPCCPGWEIILFLSVYEAELQSSCFVSKCDSTTVGMNATLTNSQKRLCRYEPASLDLANLNCVGYFKY